MFPVYRGNAAAKKKASGAAGHARCQNATYGKGRAGNIKLLHVCEEVLSKLGDLPTQSQDPLVARLDYCDANDVHRKLYGEASEMEPAKSAWELAKHSADSAEKGKLMRVADQLTQDICSGLRHDRGLDKLQSMADRERKIAAEHIYDVELDHAKTLLRCAIDYLGAAEVKCWEEGKPDLESCNRHDQWEALAHSLTRPCPVQWQKSWAQLALLTLSRPSPRKKTWSRSSYL